MGYKISQLTLQSTFDTSGYVAVAYGTETRKLSLTLFDGRYAVAPADDRTYHTSDFTTINQVADSSLNGKRYRLIWVNFGKLERGVEWDTIAGGGFKILITGFDVTADANNKFFIEFY